MGVEAGVRVGAHHCGWIVSSEVAVERLVAIGRWGEDAIEYRALPIDLGAIQFGWKNNKTVLAAGNFLGWGQLGHGSPLIQGA